MGVVVLAAWLCAASRSSDERVHSSDDERVQIAPNVWMPLMNNGLAAYGINETKALKLWFLKGGRGVDTAFNYMNHDGTHNQIEVGWAISQENLSKVGLSREDVFVTTKIPCVGNATLALEYIKEDVKMLGLKPDLVVIHSPGYNLPPPQGQPSGCWGYHPCCNGTAQLQETYRGLELALEEGLTRTIGVSNHRMEHLQAILQTAKVPPAVNQCQMYVGKHDDVAISFCHSHNITYEAYSPLGPWDKPKPVLSDPTVARIAHRLNKTSAQIGLRWINQKGLPFVTATSRAEFDGQDLSISDFALTDEDMGDLDSVVV